MSSLHGFYSIIKASTLPILPVWFYYPVVFLDRLIIKKTMDVKTDYSAI